MGPALLLIVMLAHGTNQALAEPIRLHPDNPHYFLYRNQPTILITAGEHYGAVLNLDFDYLTYLNELRAHGFNQTRVFSGFYREIPGAPSIPENTLAPGPGRFVCPWARSATPAAADGGNKFDLDRDDPRYFERLKSFLTEADQRGVVVEIVLFCTMYDDGLWDLCPLNARNNLQEVGRVGRSDVFAFKERALLQRQEAIVRKIVTELKAFDNVYYEICNEPYERGGFTVEWNDHIVHVIAETEAALARPHLIAQGVRGLRIEKPNPRVSVFNFHSALPAMASVHYPLNRPIAIDETGGHGRTDFDFRREAWTFLLAGGSVFSHLDFSFTCAHPDGTHRVTNEPGGGGPALRRQLQALKQFLEGFDFIRLKPAPGVVRNVRRADGTRPSPGSWPQALAEPGAAYAIYVEGTGPCELSLELPEGSYRAEWINPTNGARLKQETFSHCGELHRLESPAFAEDIALRIRASVQEAAFAARTRISIVNDRWVINGQLSCQGTPAEGLLPNVRMVNATFEDRNRPSFDPEANSDTFIQQIPDYVAHGVRAFTLNLQGGMPGYEGALNSGFNADGSLRDCAMKRLRRVIEACDRDGAAVILGCYYQRQDQLLKDEDAVRAGVVNVSRWIQAAGFSNVVLEIANEFGHGGFDHSILRQPEGQAGLIRLARQTAPGLLVSTSGVGDGRVPESVARASDFLLIHFNITPLDEIPGQLRALKPYGKPIVCNEDQKVGRAGAQAAELCAAHGASWGLMLEKINQRFPFTFRGAADDPVVYETFRRLTSPAPRPRRRRVVWNKGTGPL